MTRRVFFFLQLQILKNRTFSRKVILMGGRTFKKVLTLSLLFFVSLCARFIQPVYCQEPSSFQQDIDFFSRHFPRREGSEAEKVSFAYIEKRLDSLNIEYSKHTFDDLSAGHSFSASYEIIFSGEAEQTLICAFPVNNEKHDTKERNGALNLALGLSMVEQLLKSPPPFTVIILFLGAEFGEESVYPLGTHQFLRNFYSPEPSAVLYFNLKTVPRQIVIRCGANGIVTPYWLINFCSEALQSADLQFHILGTENQIFRLRSLDSSLMIGPYLSQEIPALLFEGDYEPEEDLFSLSWFFKFSSFMDAFINKSISGYPDTWDKHYLFFQFRSRFFIIEETTYLLIFLSFFGFLLLFALLFRRRIRRYRKIIFSHFWTLFILYFFIFGFLFASTLFVEALSMARGFPTLWRTVPTTFFLVKISISLLLFFALYWILRQIPFPREKSYYSAAAMYLMIMTTIIVTVFDISFSYYFIWALLWVFFFTLFHNRFLKLAAIIIAPFWLIKALTDVFLLPSLSIIQFLLFSRIYGNMMIAIMLLPFILMIIRLEFFSARHEGGREKRFITSITVFLFVMTVGLSVYLFTFVPYSSDSPQPVVVSETIEQDAGQRLLTVESPAPLTGVRIESPDYNDVRVRNVREFSVESEIIPNLVSVGTSMQKFLGRRRITVTIHSEGSPSEIAVRLLADDQIMLFDSTFPFALSPRENEAEIFIGKNPPNPLTFQFTVAEDFPVDIKLDVIYTELPHSLEVVGKNLRVEKKLTVTKYITQDVSI